MAFVKKQIYEICKNIFFKFSEVTNKSDIQQGWKIHVKVV